MTNAFTKFFNPDHDIKFRGGITYRGLRFIGLVAMTISQFGAVFYVLSKVLGFLAIEGLNYNFPEWAHILCNILGSITFPCLLIASFALVISKTEGIIRTLITNLIIAAVTYVFCAFFLPQLIENAINTIPSTLIEAVDLPKVMGILQKNPNLLQSLGLPLQGVDLSNVIGMIDWKSISPLLKNVMPMMSSYLTQYVLINYVNVNVFWDLFLCTLFYFFVSYKPKNIEGGKLVIFRCCAVLPAFYIVVCSFLGGMLKGGQINMPTWGLALLTNRSIACYILFFLIVLFLKFIETEHIYRGGTHDSYIAIMKTRKAALFFSLYVSICISIISVVDFLLKGFTTFAFWGIGESYLSVSAVPFIMLFTFNKKPKRRWPDIFIPVYYVINYTVLVFVIFVGIMAIPALLEKLT